MDPKAKVRGRARGTTAVKAGHEMLYARTNKLPQLARRSVRVIHGGWRISGGYGRQHATGAHAILSFSGQAERVAEFVQHNGIEVCLSRCGTSCSWSSTGEGVGELVEKLGVFLRCRIQEPSITVTSAVTHRIVAAANAASSGRGFAIYVLCLDPR